MLERFRPAGLIAPTLFAVAGLAVLIGLGTWQLERKQWKEGLLAKIAARIAADPIPLADAERRWLLTGDVEYLHASATGRFHHDKERYLYAPAPAGLAWHVYTPLEFAPGRIVWVNRGAVPDAAKAPERRPQGQVAGEVEVRGLIRAPARRGLFSPDNDAAHNLWYWPDTAAMTATAFRSPLVGDFLPLVLEADARPEPPGGLPRGGTTRLALPNNHLHYALTWYGLALTLIGVYLAFAVARVRLSTPN
jgi:surfeit locus 1 family protein